MIPTNGKSHILRAITGAAPVVANYILLGVGQTAEDANDTGLALEVLRLPINTISPDIDNQRAVFSAVLAPGQINTVYEVGLLYTENPGTGSMLPIPGDETSFWTNSSLVTDNAKANTLALKVDFTASSTTLAEDMALNIALSSLQGSDTIKFGFYSTSNVASLKFRFGTDAANYFEFNVPSPAPGYNITSVPASSASITGSPTWSNILYSAISVTGTSGGGGSVYLDAVRTERSPSVTGDVLVSRTVLATPYVVSTNVPNNIEYSLDVNIS